ncbi:MAG: hypothetical protein KJO92_04545 [Gammaproteobacteria bacterium]|nr:hypothetical protein [Gammaproteobacteria bacterium]
MNTRSFTLLLPLLLWCAPVAADTSYQPFILASVNDAGLQQQTGATVDALTAAGFSVAGQYSPIENANVLVATSPALLEHAAASAKGGYGAGVRIGITERDGKTEVAFVNPLYLQYAYRMDTDLQGVYDALGEALGNREAFGAEKEMTAKKLGKYHYMAMMPYFDDYLKLAGFDSHEEAVAAVENGLVVKGDALSLIYRIDIPGKNQTVFGVGMRAINDSKEEVNIDETRQLSIVDFEGYSKVAYFPYEILVDDNKVEALHMRFRMAVHFPDLSMAGKHGFTKLMASPGAVKDAFEKLVEPE